MRRASVILAAVALLGVAGLFFFDRSRSVASAGEEVSRLAADHLQAKIDAVEKASTAAERNRPPEKVEVTEAELESYVLFHLRDQIPAQIDSFEVHLTPGIVAADTQLTFNSNGQGNSVVDALLGGTHNLSLKGKLSGMDRTGKFELQEIRLDGIPVPNVLIESLFNKYVKPDYPDADLKAPFELPWNIDSVTVEQDKATITY
jgi:hypothetical protein